MLSVTHVVLAGLLAGLLAGCLPATESRDELGPSTAGTEAVALTVQPRSEWRVLWLEGETDLPDGAMSITESPTRWLARRPRRTGLRGT